jgi:WD40 repeat protein
MEPGDDHAQGLALSQPGSRVLVIGMGSHLDGSALPDLPTVAATAEALASALIDRCGLTFDRLNLIIDPADPIELGTSISEAAEAATNVLVVYYIGHGLTDLDGTLYLATRSTVERNRALRYRALSFEVVREALALCRASSTVVVLDCCDAGRAPGVLGTAFVNAGEVSRSAGGFLLASSGANESSLAPPGKPYTEFTGAFIRLLREGDPLGPPALTIDHTYRYLARVLPDLGAPAPHHRTGDRAGDIVLALNSAYRRPAPRDAPSSNDSSLTESPYRGLFGFRSSDARYFFGRRAMIGAIVARLEERASLGGVLMVVGPSGAGKSSVLRAGLLPALDRGLAGCREAWRWPRVLLQPGKSPNEKLWGVLGESFGHDLLRPPRTATAEDVVCSVRAVLARRDETEAKVEGSRLILVVDQFEQLFTDCFSEQDRETFVRTLELLSTSSDSSSPPCAVAVISVRSDFYAQCAAHPFLAKALQDAQVLVQAMTPAELREAVEGPAAEAGLSLESGLTDLVLHDLQSERGTAAHGSTLPLLSHALLETWQHSDGRTLTLAGYRASGGVSSAVARTAEKVYSSLDVDERESARVLLLSMVRFAHDSGEVSRRTDLTGLPPQARRTLPAFVTGRLIQVHENTAEFAHEALLRAWPRLRDWIERDRVSLLERQRLVDAAELWQQENGDADFLLRGTRLMEASRHIEQLEIRNPPSSSVVAFLEASRSRQDSEWAAARRRRKRVRLLAVMTIVLLFVATGTFLATLSARSEAGRQRTLEAAHTVAAAADRIRSQNPGLSLQLALSAHRLAETRETSSSLVQSVTTTFDTVPSDQPTASVRVAYNAAMHLLGSLGADKVVRIWDVGDALHPQSKAVLPVGMAGPPSFSPDGHYLLTAGEASTVQLWDITDVSHPVLDASMPLGEPGYLSATFSPDGRTIAVTGSGSLHLWNVADARNPAAGAHLKYGASEQFSSSFSADSRLLAVSGSSNTTGAPDAQVRVWEVDDIQHPQLRSTLTAQDRSGGYDAVAFSPSGRTLAIAGTETRLWDFASPANPLAIVDGAPSGGDVVIGLAFSPDGGTLARSLSVAPGGTGKVDLLDLTRHASGGQTQPPFSSFTVPGVAENIAFGEDVRTVVTGGEKARLWHLLPSSVPVQQQVPLSVGDWTLGDSALVTRTIDPDAGPEVTRRWDVTDQLHPIDREVLTLGATVKVIYRDVRSVITVAKAGAVTLWKFDQSGASAAEVQLGVASGRSSVAFDARHDLLAIAGTDSLIHLWDLAGDRPAALARIPFTGDVAGVILDSGGRLYVVDNRDLAAWDVSNPHAPVELPGIHASSQIFEVGYGVDDAQTHRIAVLTRTGPSAGGQVTIWNIEADHRFVEGPTLSTTAQTVDVSHDGRLIAVSDARRQAVTLWDAHSSQQSVEIGSFAVGAGVDQVQFSHDDRSLLVASTTSTTVQLWDVADPASISGELTFTAPGLPQLTLTSAGFSDDGQFVMMSSGGRLYFWEANAGDLAKQICVLVGNSITEQEWKVLLPGVDYVAPCG